MLLSLFWIGKPQKKQNHCSDGRPIGFWLAIANSPCSYCFSQDAKKLVREGTKFRKLSHSLFSTLFQIVFCNKKCKLEKYRRKVGTKCTWSVAYTRNKLYLFIYLYIYIYIYIWSVVSVTMSAVLNCSWLLLEKRQFICTYVSHYKFSLLISIDQHHLTFIQLDIHRLNLSLTEIPICIFIISILSHDRDIVTTFSSFRVFWPPWQ